MLMSLQFSVKISALTNQVQELAQRLALQKVGEPKGKTEKPQEGEKGTEDSD
jgi:hypothetical protein